jgi:hypothetical protein
LNNQKTANWTRTSDRGHHPGNGLLWMSAVAQTQAADEKAGPEIYQTLYLTNLTQQNDANELVTDLRNMLPNAKLYYVPSQSAISIRALQRTLPSRRRSSPTLIRPRRSIASPTP